jgi:hypothetical protein
MQHCKRELLLAFHHTNRGKESFFSSASFFISSGPSCGWLRILLLEIQLYLPLFEQIPWQLQVKHPTNERHRDNGYT